jgi:oligopeptide/dipeptide ABC transporter ATP-binding protein
LRGRCHAARLLLAGEPTTALDATVPIQVLILLRKLQNGFGKGVIFVTHDLGVAAQIADKLAVMYAGRIVEYGNVGDVLKRASHPCTLGRLASTMHGGLSRDAEIEAIPGSLPDMRRLPPGCALAPRCRYAEPACRAAVPPPIAVAPGRLTCCIKAGHLTHKPQSEIARPLGVQDRRAQSERPQWARPPDRAPGQRASRCRSRSGAHGRSSWSTDGDGMVDAIVADAVPPADQLRGPPGAASP